SLQAAEEEDPQNPNDDASSASGSTSGPDFNYILNMSLWSLTKEKVEELIKHRDSKERELNDLKRKSASDLWKEDLAAFVEELEVCTRVRRAPSSTKSSAKKVKKRNPWSDDESKSESDLEESEPVIIPRDSLLRRAAAERPKYTFDFSEEEDDADDDDDANNNNDLDELKVKASPVINDREDEFVPSDSLEKDEYDFSPVKSKPSPEKMSQEKKNQDFGNIFSFPSYSQKTDDDTTKLDSDEEDSTPVFSSPFAPKQTEKILSKTVAAKKGKSKVDAPPKPKRAPKAKKMETVNSDSDSEFGIPKKTAAPKGKGRGAKKRKASGSENEGEYNPGKKAPKSTPCKKAKKAAFDQDSDVEIFQSGFASETAPKPRTGRARKEVKYFAESDEDDDFDMFN
uniref:DTHCT domain-containing protein n=1 Tax=Pavo cristatus TaxID=9049 RepID=A0A8C9F7M5_PAVCR